jgi:membrane protein
MGVKLYLILEETYRGWSKHYVMRQSAAIAFYVLLTMVPLVMVVVSVGGALLQDATLDGTLVDRIAEVAGTEAANLVEGIVESVKSASSSTGATIVNILIALYASTAAFANLRVTLDQMWEADTSADGVKGFVVRRAVAFTFLLLLGGILLASAFVFRLMSSLGQALLDAIGLTAGRFSLLFDDVAGTVLLLLVFMAMYRLLPHKKLPWADITLGAGVTTVLFLIGEWGLSIYFSRGSHVSVYGAAGALVVLLLWLYYSWVVVLTSAEFTYAWSRRAEVWEAGDAGEITLKEAVTRTVRDR